MVPSAAPLGRAAVPRTAKERPPSPSSLHCSGKRSTSCAGCAGCPDTLSVPESVISFALPSACARAAVCLSSDPDWRDVGEERGEEQAHHCTALRMNESSPSRRSGRFSA